jgi:putative inorganic carbon (hco3(-)) transporter
VHRIVGGVLWLEPLWIVLVAPSILLRDLLWDSWVQPWIVAALFLFWPLRWWHTRRLAPSTPMNRPLALLLLWLPVTLWASSDIERSWMALGYLVLGITLYLALLNWPLTQHYPCLLVAGIGAIGLALAMTGPALLATIPSKLFIFSDELMQSKPVDLFGSGETINSNVLAGALLLPSLVLGALALRWDWRPARWGGWILPPLVGVAALFMLASLLLTQSRGAYLAVLVGMLVLLRLRWPRAWIVLAVATAAVLSVLAWDGIIFSAQAIDGGDSAASLAGRAEIWQYAAYALLNFPLTGIGIGTFDQVMPLLFPDVANLSSPTVSHAHNLILQVGLDLGIPGLLAYGWLLVAAIRVLIDILRHAGTEPSTAEPWVETAPHHHRRRSSTSWKCKAALRWTLAAGLLAGLVGLLVHGMVDAVLWGTRMATIPWLLLALTALLSLPAGKASEP